MKVLKGYRFRLKPNREQEETFRRFVGMTRKVWNAVADERVQVVFGRRVP